MREIVDGLIVGIGVHGRSKAPLDAEIVEEDLGDGGEAIRGAGSVRDELVLGRVVLPLVDTQDHRDVGVLGRGGDDHLLGSRLQVLGGGGLVPEHSRGLHHDVHTHLAPRERRWVLRGAHPHLPAVDEDRLALVSHFTGEDAVDRIVLQQMRQRLGVRQVVDRHDFDLRLLERRPEEHPPDSSEPVDTDSHAHDALLER